MSTRSLPPAINPRPRAVIVRVDRRWVQLVARFEGSRLSSIEVQVPKADVSIEVLAKVVTLPPLFVDQLTTTTREFAASSRLLDFLLEWLILYFLLPSSSCSIRKRHLGLKCEFSDNVCPRVALLTFSRSFYAEL